VREGVVNGQVVQTPLTIQWKGKVAPTVADTAKILEHFMELASREIDVIATRVKFEPAAQAAVVQILHGLSAASKTKTIEITTTIQGLSEKDREAVLSPLVKSGLVDTMNLLIPLLELGDATDPGFLMQEAAKNLYALANMWSWIAGVNDPGANPIVVMMACATEVIALQIDLSSQLSGQADDELMQETIQTMEQQIVLMDQKISYIMDLPEGAVVPKTPPDTKPVSLTALEKMLEVCKKFYKFEGCFTPTFEKDKQLIRIGPLATVPIATPPIPLLVTGFIDLGAMQDNDVVTITTKVLEPPCSSKQPGTGGFPRYVIWRVKTFTGHQSSGMKHFQEFADLLEVPGDGVELLIAQSASSHNFDKAFLLTIPYQFLVESTIEPQFSLT
jgi:hypothetical protein